MIERPLKLLRHWGVLYLFLLPAVVLSIIFAYLPMFSNIIAFMDYDLFNGWMGLNSPFVGLDNFSFLFDPWFHELLIRTLTYSVSMLLFSFPLALVLALLFNELRNALFKKIVQTIAYVPHFVSWVTVAALVYVFLSIDATGFVNNIKQMLFGGERIVFMQDSSIFLPILILTNLWKNVGFDTILFLAAIATINPELYASASMDGANRWQRMRYITLPLIVPTISLMLIFALSGLMATNFDQIYNLQNSVIRNDTNTINVYVYYKGITEQQYSLSTAVGLFNGLVSLCLILLANKLSMKFANISFFGRKD